LKHCEGHVALNSQTSANISEMVLDRTIVTMVDYPRIVCPQPNHVVIDDLGWPLKVMLAIILMLWWPKPTDILHMSRSYPFWNDQL